MQIQDARQAMRIPPVLRLGFRPFFLLGALLAALAVPLWLLALHGEAAALEPVGGWLAWHRHELVFGFAGAIIAGFLLTAVQTWTGRPGLSGMRLALLVGLWLLARLGWWFGGAPVLLLASVAFYAGVAFVMARMLWAVRQHRNYPVVGLLVLMLLGDGLSLLGVQYQQDGWQRQGSWAAIWLVAAMMTLIGGRVIPFFTQRGLGRDQAVQPWPRLDAALLGGSVLIALAYASGVAFVPQPLVAVLFLALTAGHALRLFRWFDAALLRAPLLWSLHLAYAWMLSACAGFALWHFGLLANPSPLLHALTVGAMGGLILAMLARVSLGHTGRPLELPRGFAVAFVLLNLGAVARVFGVAIDYLPALSIAALCWSLAFAAYLWRYGPMLLRGRADGRPG